MADDIGKNTGKLSISKRMIIIYAFCVLIPACTLLYVYYLKSTSTIEEEVAASMLQTMKQCDINISSKLSNIEAISDELFMNPILQEFVGDENGDDILYQYTQSKEIKEKLVMVKNSKDIYRIRIFVNGNKLASSEKVNFFSIDDLKNKLWYENVINNYGRIYWSGAYKETYPESNEVYVISCARIIKHSYNYIDNDGVLMIDIPESNIYSILSDTNTQNNKVFILDSEGKIVSDSDKDMLGKEIKDKKKIDFIYKNDSGIEKINEDGRRHIVVYQTIQTNGWKLVSEMDIRGFVKNSTILNNITVFLMIIITILIIAFGIFLIFAHVVDVMNQQVKNMVVVAEQVGINDMDVSFTANTKGDLTSLEKHVNIMIQKIRALMEEAYQSKIKEREAQVNALQAQINPHFLYNTLDTINWMAVKIGANEISFIVNTLAKYFRLSLSNGKTIVTIKDELELIKVYLTIQQIRYKKAIEFEFRIDDVVNDYSIQKLTLQPIVENAIVHGLQKNANRGGRITVEAKKCCEDIIFVISDTGVGIDEEIIEKVLNNLPNGKEGSYGLYNVNERIKLFFGNEYGIKIESQKGIGTSVRIKIKATLYES